MKQFLFLLVALFSLNAIAGTVYFPISTVTLSAPSNAQVLYYKDADKAMAYSDVIDLLAAASASVNGYLSSTDWSTFNGKQDALGFTAEDSANKITSITGTSSASYTSEVSVVDYVASEISGLQVRVSGTCASGFAMQSVGVDGSVGCEAMTATPAHNDLSGLQGGTTAEYYHLTSTEHVIATQAATASVAGYLSASDWSIFNGKQDALSAATASNDGYLTMGDWSTFNGKQDTVSATAPVEIAAGVISMSAAASGVDGYLTSGDWATFNGKQATVSATAPVEINANVVSMSAAASGISGYLTATDWATFNGKQDVVSAGTGISFVSGTISADFTATQARVSGTCAGAMSAIAQNGTVSCNSIPTIGRYVADLTFNGTDLSKNVSVSGSITDARNAIIQLKQNSNGFEVTGVSLQSVADSVTITTSIALPAGDYRLIVLE